MDVWAEVRARVVAIPPGSVLAYGEIGRALGIGPRQAGRAVALLGNDVPWWRVVHADGVPATCHGGGARALLAAEGVPFRGDRVDMAEVRADRAHVRHAMKTLMSATMCHTSECWTAEGEN